MPIQAVHVRSELSKHQSWSPKWFRTNEGRAYLDLARPEQRDQLLKFLASQVAASGGKKMRGRSVPDADVSGTEAESAPDEFSGFDLFTRVERVEAEHLGLVASGTTLSNRILAAVGAAGCSGAGDIDRARSLPVLLQEGMNSHPLLVWTFPYYVYALPSIRSPSENPYSAPGSLRPTGPDPGRHVRGCRRIPNDGRLCRRRASGLVAALRHLPGPAPTWPTSRGSSALMRNPATAAWLVGCTPPKWPRAS